MDTKDKRNPKNWTQEEKDNIVGFFSLLLKVDRGQNPELYKKEKDLVFMELDEIKEKIINKAKVDLKKFNAADGKDGNYKDFLESMAVGRCRQCKSELEIVYADESPDGFSYKFACGHGHSGITVKDSIEMKERLKMRKKAQGAGKYISESIQGWFPSIREDLSPEGVRKIRIIDREKDYYKEEVIDQKTGRVIRSVEEKLSEHRK